LPSNGFGYPKLMKRFFHPPNLSFPILAALTPKSHIITFIDDNIEKIPYRKTFDLVAISVNTPNAPHAYEIADNFRKFGTKVVLGGIHVSMLPEEASRHCDSVICGEAESIWDNVLSDAEANQLKKVYKASEYVCPSKIPIPDRSILRWKSLLPLSTIQISRGCPHKCSFCSVSAFFGGTYRYKPVEEVIKEISALKRSFIFFVDDNIVGNPSYAEELFTALKPLKVKWISQSSLEICKKPHLLKLARESGCYGLMFGFDSVVPTSIKEMSKAHNKSEKYFDYIRLVQEHGIATVGSFIFGFDHDDESVFEKTVSFALESHLDLAYFFMLTPYPGTSLYNKLEAEERIFERDWSKYDTYNAVFIPKQLSCGQLVRGTKYAWETFYSAKNIAIRMIKKPRVILLAMNIFFNLRRKTYLSDFSHISEQPSTTASLGETRIQKGVVTHGSAGSD